MASSEYERLLEQIRLYAATIRRRHREYDLRAFRARMVRPVVPPPAEARVEPVDAAGVAADWVRSPGSDPDRRLLYLHGGAYVAGTLGYYRPLAAWLAASSGCSVLLPDYRLAPEHPFPAALEDAQAAWGWMREHGPEGPGEARRSVVAGDSAGAGLALASMMALRRRGLPLPRAAALLSPYLDLTFDTDSVRAHADLDPVVDARFLHRLAAAYLDGTDPRDPLASPFWGDPTGLPPLLIQVGDGEVMLDDSTRFAAKARGAGVEVILEVLPEMIHGFQIVGELFPEGREAIHRIGAFLGG